MSSSPERKSTKIGQPEVGLIRIITNMAAVHQLWCNKQHRFPTNWRRTIQCVSKYMFWGARNRLEATGKAKKALVSLHIEKAYCLTVCYLSYRLVHDTSHVAREIYVIFEQFAIKLFVWNIWRACGQKKVKAHSKRVAGDCWKRNEKKTFFYKEEHAVTCEFMFQML